MAARENIPLHEVPGTGPSGRVIKRDVESYRASAPSPAAPRPATPAATALVAAPAAVPATATSRALP